MGSRVLNELRLRARRWLIANDPTPDSYWESAPLDSDFVGDLRQNVRDFGPSSSGRRILNLWDRHGGNHADEEAAD